MLSFFIEICNNFFLSFEVIIPKVVDTIIPKVVDTIIPLWVLKKNRVIRLAR